MKNAYFCSAKLKNKNRKEGEKRRENSLRTFAPLRLNKFKNYEYAFQTRKNN